MTTDRQRIDFDTILHFIRAHGWGVVVRAVLSLGAVVALLALIYAFAPREESWRQELAVTLEKRNGNVTYPNDRLFSATDLLSASVMNRVWQEQGLSGKVKFEDFCKWFSIVSYDRERAKIDAEYRVLMSKRNITVAELSTLQRDYEAKLAASEAGNRYLLAMVPSAFLSKEASVALLQAIPSAWFAEYSVLNAPTMPSIMRADVLSAYAKRMQAGDGRSLEMVDALRLYVKEISATCVYIRDRLLCGRNALVDGVDLGAYEARLDLVQSEILRFKNRLLVNGEPKDLESFVAARLDDMACETLAAEEKANAAKQTIELLAEVAGTRRSGQVKEKTSSEGAVTLQADTTFFHDFTSMVRRDANQEAVQRYADELTKYRKELADIKARQLYYDQIGQYVAKTRARSDAKEVGVSLAADVTAFSSELIDIGNKVIAFRDQCLKLYRTPDLFYALPSPVCYARSFGFSMVRLALGLLAIWALYNLFYLVHSWNRRVD